MYIDQAILTDGSPQSKQVINLGIVKFELTDVWSAL